MVTKAASIVTAFVTAWSLAARAEPPERDPSGGPAAGVDAAALSSDAYCLWVRAVADSQAAPLLSPQIFGTLGVINAVDTTSGQSNIVGAPRVMAGVGYSVAGLYRGIQTRKIAGAECDRYRLSNKLLAYTFAHASGQSKAANEAKLAVLDAAMKRADEIAERARAALTASRIDVDEMNAVLFRVDELQALRIDTRDALRRAAGAMKAPDEPLAELLERRDRAEERVEEHAAKIRQSQAWDIQVRGGYDQLLGVSQSQPVPLFGTVTLTLNPGYLWQLDADARAVRARGEASHRSLEAGSARAENTARVLREMLAAERLRLAELAKLVAELESRERELGAVEGERARAAADLLWLRLVPLQAERAYLAVHVVELGRMLR